MILFNVKLLNKLFDFLRFIEEYRLILNVAIRFVLKYHRKYSVLLILIHCKLYNNRIYFFFNEIDWPSRHKRLMTFHFSFFSTFFFISISVFRLNWHLKFLFHFIFHSFVNIRHFYQICIQYQMFVIDWNFFYFISFISFSLNKIKYKRIYFDLSVKFND